MEPPPAFHATLSQLLQNPAPGMHRYMPNADVETRAAVAAQLAKETGVATAEHIVMCVGAAAGINVVLKRSGPWHDEASSSPLFRRVSLMSITRWSGQSRPHRCPFRPRSRGAGKRSHSTPKPVLITPNNPTGVIYPASTLKQFGRAAPTQGAAV
jgi:aspartate aminotransferase